ncbi:MAG: hypothetical protein ACFFA0_09355 [Promethearchaeota archaeon]
MEEKNLIFTLSGIQGIIGKDLNFNIAKKISIAFGLWLNSKEKKVIISKDTRPSGKVLEKAVIEGLIGTGNKVVNLRICPTPITIYTKNKYNIPGGIIITGSHNPQEWNGLKLLSLNNFVNKNDLEQISNIINKIDIKFYPPKKRVKHKQIEILNPIPEYIQDLYKFVDQKRVKKKNNLRVVIDTGAGTGKFATPKILEGMGCEVKLLNNDLLLNNLFPREIEPIEKNLSDLRMEVWQGDYDIGFAHDSDADRLAIIGENGVCYPEDISLALITDYYLRNDRYPDAEKIFVTNLASSLRFDVIVEKYNAKIIRTPVGERFLSEKMTELIEKQNMSSKTKIIFGGEGSCGGFMYPNFNNTRDAIFAATKIIEILVKTNKPVSELVFNLPKFHSCRKKIIIKDKRINSIIDNLKNELIEEGEQVEQIGLDLRFGKGKEWFVLIHPSNTEPIIRIISEAKRESLARVYCEATTELVKLIISKM